MSNPDPISKWPTIRHMLASLADQIGYLTLQSYYKDRTGAQIGRFNVTPRMVAYWLENGPADPVGEDRYRQTIAKLSQPTPAAAPDDDDFAPALALPVDNDPDEDDPDEDDLDAADADGNDAEGVDDDTDDDGDDDADTDDEGVDDDDAGDDDVEAPVPAAVPVVPAATEPTISTDDCLAAIRGWLLKTLEDNTPLGERATFRLRVYQPTGATQLWSVILPYASQASPPPRPTYRSGVNPQPVPPSIPSTPSPPHADDDFNDAAVSDPSAPHLSWGDLDDDENAIAELLMTGHNDDLGMEIDLDDLDGPEDFGLTPEEQDDLNEVVRNPGKRTTDLVVREADKVKRNAQRKGGPRGAPPYEVRTILHLHGLHRAFAAHVLNTAKSINKMSAEAMNQVAGMLGDARIREGELVETIQGLRLMEAEKAVEAANNQDKTSTRAVLGKTAIEQGGLLARVLLTRGQNLVGEAGAEEADDGYNNGNGGGREQVWEYEPDDYAEPRGRTADVPHPRPYVEAPANGGQQQPISTVDPQAVESVAAWVENRPDLAAALNNPAVRAYLRESGNVEQVVGLAEMMVATGGIVTGPDPLEAAIPLASEPPTEADAPTPPTSGDPGEETD